MKYSALRFLPLIIMITTCSLMNRVLFVHLAVVVRVIRLPAWYVLSAKPGDTTLMSSGPVFFL